jgi:hypothetical protein
MFLADGTGELTRGWALPSKSSVVPCQFKSLYDFYLSLVFKPGLEIIQREKEAAAAVKTE